MLKRGLVIMLLIIGSAVIASAQTAATSFSQGQAKDDKYWALSKKYCNARFGFCVSYPASLVMGDPPANDDGRSFDNGNGLSLTVSGINNVSNDTLESEMRSDSDRFDRITYRAKGKNWFVLSGYKDDKIVYLKTFIGRGSVNHLDIEYSVHLKAVYDTVAGNIARSFKAGQLGISH